MDTQATQKHQILVTSIVLEGASDNLSAFACRIDFGGGLASMTFRLPEPVPVGNFPDETIRTQLQILIDTIDRAAATAQTIRMDHYVESQLRRLRVFDERR